METINVLLIDESKESMEKLKEQMSINSKFVFVAELDNAINVTNVCKTNKIDIAIINVVLKHNFNFNWQYCLKNKNVAPNKNICKLKD